MGKEADFGFQSAKIIIPEAILHDKIDAGACTTSCVDTALDVDILGPPHLGAKSEIARNSH